MNALVQTHNLSLSYGKRKVLNAVSIKVEPGRIVGLLGPNGCGKTSLLKVLAGLHHDYTGDVRVAGHIPSEFTKGLISYLPEKTYLGNWMRIRDSISMFSDFYTDFDCAKAKEMIKRFSLEEDMRIKNMSKGMQEKLQIILVMSRQAQLYLLDEPLGGVDPASRSLILDTILKNYAEDASILLTTHLITDVERIFDSVILLGFGEVVLQDSVDNIRQETGKTVNDVFREVFRC